MPDNPFAWYSQQQSAPAPEASASAPESNPFSWFNATKNDDPSEPAAPEPTENNPFSWYTGAGKPQSHNPQPHTSLTNGALGDIWNDPNSGVGSKLWDTINTPVFDVKRDGATGVEAGLENFASGLTSPLSLAMAAVTFGAGGVLEDMGLNVAKMAAPEVANAAKTVGTLMKAGFTAMQLKGIADASPHFVQAIKDGDTDRALETGTEIALNAGMAGLGVREGFKDYFGQQKANAVSTTGDRLVGRYQRMLKEDTEQARSFNSDFRKAVPDADRRSAIQMYAEAGGDMEKLSQWKAAVESSDKVRPSLQKQVLAALDGAQNLSEQELGQAQSLRQMYDTDFQEAADKGVLTVLQQRENYAARARWADEPEEGDNLVHARVSLGQDTTLGHTLRRYYDSTVDGILAGKTPKKINGRYMLDAADIAGDYHRQIGREIARANFIEEAQNTLHSDGRPFAVPLGEIRQDPANGDWIVNGEKIDPARHGLDVDTKFHDYDRTVRNTARTSDVLLADGGHATPEMQMGLFGPEAAYPGHEQGVLLESKLAFHPEIAKQARSILAPEPSAIEQSKLGSALLKGGRFVKESLLGGSPFHWIQEGLRGIESGINPFNPEKWDMQNPEHVKLIEAGGIQPGIEQNMNVFTEGNKGGGILSTIPGVRGVVHASNEALFGPGGYIDRLKLSAAMKFADRLANHYPELDEMSRYKLAGEMANARFGGLNYLAMGRSRQVQSMLRLTLLAPDWLESQMRDTAFAAGPFGKLGRFDLARIALYNFGVAQALNLATTGKVHPETPFSVQSSDGKTLYSVRTMPQDIFHSITDLRGFAYNRLSPAASGTVESLTGRDKRGHARDMSEQLSDLFKNLVPIPGQSYAERIMGSSTPDTGSRTAASLLGATASQNTTPAEKLAFQFSSDRSASGPVASEALGRHHRMFELEDRLRSGDQAARRDLLQSIQSGELTHADGRNVLQSAKTSRIVSLTSRLPITDAMQVWSYADKDERQALAPVLVKKIVRYRTTEARNTTPSVRARVDPQLAILSGEIADTLQKQHAQQ